MAKKERQNLEKAICVRFTKKEYETMEQACKTQGYRSRSAYMHHCIMTKAERSIKSTVQIVEIDTLQRILRELNRIGVNINQSVRKLNTFDPRGEKVISYEAKKLQEMLQTVTDIVKEMNGEIRSFIMKTQETASENKENNETE